MTWTNDDLLALKSELTNDPADLGLTVDSADDEANANKLNAASESIQVLRYSLSASDLFNCVDPSEFQSLGAGQQAWLNAVLNLNQINPYSNTQIITGIRNLFSAQTGTRPAFEDAIVEVGSRITQLFQDGTLSNDAQVTPSDVANARNAT
jgi:hypothetical protein